MRVKKLAFIIGLCVLAVVIGCAIMIVLANRAWHEDAVINNASMLASLVSDWEKATQSSINLASISDWNEAARMPNRTLTNLLASCGSYKPFLFTNTVQVEQTNYHCLFGIRDEFFSKDEMLAATTDGVVIWIKKGGNQLLIITKDGRLIWVDNKR